LLNWNKGRGFKSVRLWPALSRLETGLDGGQTAEKPPWQAGVVGEDDALSLENHGGYIAIRTSLDNEGDAVRHAARYCTARKQKGPNSGPLKQYR